MPHTIVIVGAGPRGTYGFRRLALKLSNTPLRNPVDIHVVERSGNFGGGFVHSPDQPDYLLLNTVASQVTAVGDDDDQARESNQRRTLHGYLASQGVDIGPNDYPARAHHGQYLDHVYRWTEKHLPQGVRLHRHAAAALDIDSSRGLKVILADGQEIEADEILLVTGHAVNEIRPGSQEEAWSRFAEEQRQKGKNVSYVHHVYPIDQNTRHIRPGEGVYVVGMGLTAIDVVRTFTLGRGGRFEGDAYAASGAEPLTILGSRIGLPYSARAHNQKTDQYRPVVFTTEAVRKMKAGKEKLDFRTDLFPLIFLEMSYVYYSLLMGETFGKAFLEGSPQDREAMIHRGVPAENILKWEALVNPLAELERRAPQGKPIFESMRAYRSFVEGYLRADIEEAEMGNMTSPLKGAVDSVLRDCRDILRAAVNFGGLTAASHQFLNRTFDRVNNRIAVGPPVESSKQILRLVELGRVDFSGPNPQISMDPDRGEFLVESPQVKNSVRFVQHIINGRIHGVNLRSDSSTLMKNLFKRGMIRTFVNKDEDAEYSLGGLDVTSDFHIISQRGEAHPHICALGIPTEGKIWFNAADARPDVNSTAITHLSDWAEAAVERLRAKE